jgi:hypothetical protein
MKPIGVLPATYVLKPGPLKLPRTFCEPCAIITAANPKRIGTVNQAGDVAMIRLNIFDLVFDVDYPSAEIVTSVDRITSLTR